MGHLKFITTISAIREKCSHLLGGGEKRGEERREERREEKRGEKRREERRGEERRGGTLTKGQ